MNKTARILLTLKCNRSCYYCCNEKSGTSETLAGAIPVEIYDTSFQQFDSVVISGGEPLLFPSKVKQLASHIKNNADIPIFLQTALFTKHLPEIMQLIDGVTFTIHQQTKPKDVNRFMEIQELAKSMPGKSFRLNVHYGFEGGIIPIQPTAWKEIRFFHHRDHCPLPLNETLFTLKG